MAESICSTLRDGGLEGEHAPALTIKDTVLCPLGPFVLDHILCQVCSFILSHRSQSKGIVLVAQSRSPIYYEELLKSQGYVVASSCTWNKVLDCCSDPFGWKRRLVEMKTELLDLQLWLNLVKMLRTWRNYPHQLSNWERNGWRRKRSFYGCHRLDNVSCVFWLLHSDLHDNGITAALEYMSSMQHEEIRVEKSGIKFSPVSSEDDLISQSIVPKVRFNLQLSEKERNDREKVVLPFEHQGNGKNIQIYDGRKPLNAGEEGMKHASVERVQAIDSSKGEILYFRDSDEEMPDSDEDPDDDLDI